MGTTLEAHQWSHNRDLKSESSKNIPNIQGYSSEQQYELAH